MRILIVEDDKVSARIASRLFSKFGSTEIAENGEDALVAFETSLEEGESFDLVVLDIMLPLVSGQEALAVMREIEVEHGITLGNGVKVIMCTALADGDNIHQAISNGCLDYLNKPLSADAVARVMTKHGLTEHDVL